MRVGIIVAEKEEQEAIEKIIQIEKRKIIFELTFYEGKVGNIECILIKSGVGKVNAARTTQMLIDNYLPDYIINIGVAGGLNPILQIGDIVIGETLVQHDFDITAFKHKKGYVPNIGDKIEADKRTIEKFEQVISNKISEYKIKKGVIASGDIFCTSSQMKDKIYTKFNAECVEMEGAAVAQVCYLCSIPFVVIRSISDTPNGKNEITYEQFINLASKRCANILQIFLSKLFNT